MKNERDEALYQQFKKVWAQNPELSYDEAVEMAIHSRQPRLWVSFYGIYRLLLKILYNSRNGTKRKAKCGLEETVRNAYLRLKKQPIFRDASAYFLAAFIIAEPAKGFYISHAYAKKIIWKVRKQHRARRRSS